MIIGYYRHLSPHEDPGQAEEMAPAVVLRVERCGRIESDPPGERTQLQAVLDGLESGDVLVAPSCLRLARSVGEICRIAAVVHDRRATLRLAAERIDTKVPAARQVLSMLGAYDSKVADRLRANGRREAHERGARPGRPPKIAADQLARLKREAAEGRSHAALARDLGVHPTTVMRLLRREG